MFVSGISCDRGEFVPRRETELRFKKRDRAQNGVRPVGTRMIIESLYRDVVLSYATLVPSVFAEERRDFFVS